MFVKLFHLYKIGRKLAVSGSINTIDEIYNLPFIIKLLFKILSFGSTKKENISKKPGQKLCNALEGMGTTFIKLGQFLATRPDIIGEELAEDLSKLQDKLPAFQTSEAKKIIKKN